MARKWRIGDKVIEYYRVNEREFIDICEYNGQELLQLIGFRDEEVEALIKAIEKLEKERDGRG